MIRYLLATLAVIGAIAFVLNSKEAASKQPLYTAAEEEPSIKKVEVAAPTDPAWIELLEDYTKFVQHAIDKQYAPGAAVAIVRDSSIIFMKGFGYRDVNTKDVINEQTVFRLGSVSKCFAAVLSGIMVQENLLSWDDPVTHFLPDFTLQSEDHTQHILVKHVLSHTLGLPYHAFTTEVEEGFPLDTLLSHLAQLPLTGRPGQYYSYQNVAYSLIGNVIRAATGKEYNEVMDEKVFKPLGMYHASLDYESLIREENAARPHMRTRRGWVTVPYSSTYYNVAPAGGLNASVQDVALFLSALTRSSHPLLEEEVRRDMFSPFIKATAKNRYFYQWKRPVASYYGLGWRVIKYRNETVNYHGGYVNGFRSEIALHQEDNVSICVLVNSPGALADQAVPYFFKLYDRLKAHTRALTTPVTAP